MARYGAPAQNLATDIREFGNEDREDSPGSKGVEAANVVVGEDNARLPTDDEEGPATLEPEQFTCAVALISKE